MHHAMVQSGKKVFFGNKTACAVIFSENNEREIMRRMISVLAVMFCLVGLSAGSDFSTKKSMSATYLTATIFGEARGESEEGKRAVATVIYNRATDYMSKHKCNWDTAIAKVCRQKHAFACWNSGWPKTPNMKLPLERDAWGEGCAISQEIIMGKFVPLNEARFYHEVKLKPRWARNMTLLARIDRHKFYID